MSYGLQFPTLEPAAGGDASPRAANETTVMAFLASTLYAGPHNIVAHWAERLGERGLRVIAVLPPEAGDAADVLRASGAEVRLQAFGRPRRGVRGALRWLIGAPADVLTLRSLIARERPDYVAVMRAADVAPALAARLAGVRIVWHVLDSAPPAWARRVAGWLALRVASCVPVMTPAIARMHGLQGRARVRHIGPPSDESRFSAVRARDGASGDRTLRVAVVAQLTPMKGIEYFIRAAASAAREVANLECIVVGGESVGHEAYARQLRDEARALRARVRFAGARRDLPEVFAGIDLLVISSVERSEGLPTVMLNAIAAGVPVLATHVGGIADVIEHGRSGLLVRPRDEQALAGSMVRLLKDETLRRRLADCARTEVLPRYSIDAWTEAYADVFALGGIAEVRRAA